MILKANTPRTLTSAGRATVLGLALLALPFVPARGQDSLNGHGRTTDAKPATLAVT